MKVGDTVYAEVFSFFDIHKIKIKRETNEYFVFEINGKDIRRKRIDFFIVSKKF